MPEIPFRRILLHPATLFVGCVILTVIGTVMLWEQNSKHFLESHNYDLSPDKIIVEGEPALAEQLKSHILDGLAETNPNTLDTALVSKVAAITESQPYVQVSRIKKTIDRLHIEAQFKTPVAIVELGKLPIAIDANAVLLDGRVYPMQTPEDFLKISVDRAVDEGLNTWEVWPDARIQAAAQVCHEIQPVWKELGLYRVVTYWKPNQSPNSNDVFELWTAYGDKIIWSNVSAPNLASTEAKIALIRNYIAENGSLEKLGGRNKLDVRNGQAILQRDVRTAEKGRLLFSKVQDIFKQIKR
jgi:hypothetical protein